MAVLPKRERQFSGSGVIVMIVLEKACPKVYPTIKMRPLPVGKGL